MRTLFNENSLTGKRIKIIYCWSTGSEYNNLIPNSIHTIIPPPKPNYKNNLKHVWIKGQTEPVILLEGEFEILKQKRTKHK